MYIGPNLPWGNSFVATFLPRSRFHFKMEQLRELITSEVFLLCAISYISLQMAAHWTYLLCQLFWNIYYHKHVQSITLYQWKRSVQQFSWWPFEELWRRRTDMVVSCQKVFGGLWNISLESNAKLQEGAVIICHHKETSYHRSLTQ